MDECAPHRSCAINANRNLYASDTEFLDKAEVKLNEAKFYLEDNFGIAFENNENLLGQFFQKENIGTTVDFLRKFLTTILMTAFFVVLWLAESINVHKLLNNTILRKKTPNCYFVDYFPYFLIISLFLRYNKYSLFKKM